MLSSPTERERAEQEVAAHAELHDDLDAELDAVLSELGKARTEFAAFAAGVERNGGTTSAPEALWGGSTASAPLSGYDDQWDKYDDYGE